MTPKQFALMIEKRASKKKISHMDAVLDYCNEKEIEPDQITHLINRNLKDNNNSQRKQKKQKKHLIRLLKKSLMKKG